MRFISLKNKIIGFYVQLNQTNTLIAGKLKNYDEESKCYILEPVDIKEVMDIKTIPIKYITYIPEDKILLVEVYK